MRIALNKISIFMALKQSKIFRFVNSIILAFLLGLTTFIQPVCAVSIENPLSVDTVPELINLIIQAVLGVVGALAVAMIVYGGIMYITSGGREEVLNQAKNILTFSIAGLIIIFASYVIVNYVIKALTGG